MPESTSGIFLVRTYVTTPELVMNKHRWVVYASCLRNSQIVSSFFNQFLSLKLTDSRRSEKSLKETSLLRIESFKQLAQREQSLRLELQP